MILCNKKEIPNAKGDEWNLFCINKTPSFKSTINPNINHNNLILQSTHEFLFLSCRKKRFSMINYTLS